MNDLDEAWESYFIPGTTVLNNKLGITSKEELLQMETDISFEKLLELHDNPITGNFDKTHLCDIHAYIFGDIYPFAGKYRYVDVTKVGSFYFTPARDIDRNLGIVLAEMHEELKTCHTKKECANFLAEYYYDILTVHPFREGNGRTVREFLRELVLVYMPGFYLDWSRFDKDRLNEAMQYAFIGKSSLENQFFDALMEVDKAKEIDTRTENR